MMFGMVSTVSNLAVRASGFEGLTHWLERRADLIDGLSPSLPYLRERWITNYWKRG